MSKSHGGKIASKSPSTAASTPAQDDQTMTKGELVQQLKQLWYQQGVTDFQLKKAEDVLHQARIHSASTFSQISETLSRLEGYESLKKDYNRGRRAAKALMDIDGIPDIPQSASD